MSLFSRTKYILTGANVLQKVLVGTQSEVQHVIQERMKELQELSHNVEVLKVSSVTTLSTYSFIHCCHLLANKMSTKDYSQ